MTKTKKISSGQNIIDLAITHTGSVEGIFSLIENNADLGFNSILEPGQEFTLENVIPVKKNVVNFLADQNIQINTGDLVVDTSFNWEFITLKNIGSSISLQFNGSGGTVLWGNNEESNFASNELIAFTFNFNITETIKVRFGDASLVSDIIAANNHISGILDLTVFQNIENADFSNNKITNLIADNYIKNENLNINLNNNSIDNLTIQNILNDIKTKNESHSTTSTRVIDFRNNLEQANNDILTLVTELEAFNIQILIDFSSALALESEGRIQLESGIGTIETELKD